ncbi:MAG: transcriptional regulator [Actinomycetia bacterium]|nr:transcriptional regulator [Actinomycetes bacterium]
MTIPTRTLVLGTARRDGTIRAEDVYRVAEASGQSTEQVRSCLRRIVSEGLYERDGSGRKAVFTPTAAGAATLGARLRRVRLSFAQDAAGRGWDRNWRLVAFAVPEANRASRDALRDRLRDLGGAPIQGGLYVSPHPWEPDVKELGSQLGVGDNLTFASTDDLEVGRETDPRKLASMLWPIEEVGAAYARFVETYRHLPAELESLRLDRGRVSDAELFPRMLAMGVGHDEISGVDPFLPPELLPRPWAGRAARELVVKCRKLAHQVRESGSGTGLFDGYDSFVLDITG